MSSIEAAANENATCPQAGPRPNEYVRYFMGIFISPEKPGLFLHFVKE